MRRITIVALSVVLAVLGVTVSAVPGSAAGVVGTAYVTDSEPNPPVGQPLLDTGDPGCRPMAPAGSARNNSSVRSISLYANLLDCQNNNPITTLPPKTFVDFSGIATAYRVH